MTAYYQPDDVNGPLWTAMRTALAATTWCRVTDDDYDEQTHDAGAVLVEWTE